MQQDLALGGRLEARAAQARVDGGRVEKGAGAIIGVAVDGVAAGGMLLLLLVVLLLLLLDGGLQLCVV